MTKKIKLKLEQDGTNMFVISMPKKGSCFLPEPINNKNLMFKFAIKRQI